MSVSLTGADAISINGRNLDDLADGDAVQITFPNEKAVGKASKNGNTIFAKNEQGRVALVSIRIIMGSKDDKFLNSLMQTQDSDFSKFNLLTGQFTKRVGDGLGVMSNRIYALSGGVFTKQVEAKTSSEGDTGQSVSVYSISFAYSNVSIQ